MDLSRLNDVFRPSDFAEPASCDHPAMYADAVVHLLASGGAEQVSMGAVARWMRQVPSAVKQRAGGRDEFLRMVMIRFADRWLRWVSRPARDLSTVVRLPNADDEVHGIRVWSALGEIAAGEARAGRTTLAEILAATRLRHREHLRSELAHFLPRPPTATEVLLVDYLGEALRTALTAPTAPLEPAEAEAVLAWITDHLRRSA